MDSDRVDRHRGRGCPPRRGRVGGAVRPERAPMSLLRRLGAARHRDRGVWARHPGSTARAQPPAMVRRPPGRARCGGWRGKTAGSSALFLVTEQHQGSPLSGSAAASTTKAPLKPERPSGPTFPACSWPVMPRGQPTGDRRGRGGSGGCHRDRRSPRPPDSPGASRSRALLSPGWAPPSPIPNRNAAYPAPCPVLHRGSECTRSCGVSRAAGSRPTAR